MKKTILMLLLISSPCIFFSCKDNSAKETHTQQNSTESTTEADDNSSGTKDIANNDDRLNNAGDAKIPKGKMSFKVDGQSITIDENQVQSMYIGLNSTMAQSVISGSNQVTIVHMGIPKVGEIKIENIGSLPSVGIQVIIDGVQYTNKKPADARLTITKVTPNGKNYYVAGTFSGTLKSLDEQKSITVTDGVFESAYL
mgnify:FL=1